MYNQSSGYDDQWQLWEVFVQEKSGDPHIHAGNVHASDAEMAIQNARDLYARRGPVNSIWVAPSDSIKSTTPGENEYMFDPSDDKVYRHPQFYKVPKGVKNI